MAPVETQSPRMPVASFPVVVVAMMPLVSGVTLKLSVALALRVIVPREAVSEVAAFCVSVISESPAWSVVLWKYWVFVPPLNPLNVSVAGLTTFPAENSAPPPRTSAEPVVLSAAALLMIPPTVGAPAAEKSSRSCPLCTVVAPV